MSPIGGRVGKKVGGKVGRKLANIFVKLTMYSSFRILLEGDRHA